MRERSSALVLYRSPAALRGFRAQRRLRREVASLQRACQLAQAEAKRCANVFESRIAPLRETLGARLQQVSGAFGALIADDTLHGSVRCLAKDALTQVMSELDWVTELDSQDVIGGLCGGTPSKTDAASRRPSLGHGPANDSSTQRQLALALGAALVADSRVVDSASSVKTPLGDGLTSTEPPPAHAPAALLTSTFRRLAAATHPDTARTPAERLRRERQMRRLTAAYRQGDVAGLLDLEQTIRKNGAAIAPRTRRSLKDTMQALRTQRLRLVRQLAQLRLQSPSTVRPEGAMFAPLEERLLASVARLEAALQLVRTLRSDVAPHTQQPSESAQLWTDLKRAPRADGELDPTEADADPPAYRDPASTDDRALDLAMEDPGLVQTRHGTRAIAGQPGKRRPGAAQLQSTRTASHSVRVSERTGRTTTASAATGPGKTAKRDQLAAMLAARIAKRRRSADTPAKSSH